MAAVMKLHRRWLLLVASLGFLAPARAEEIKIGILKVPSSGPVYLAQEMGFFAAEGLQASFVNFEAGQAVAVAVIAGDADVGVTGLTASLYNLALRGEMRVLAGFHREAPGFRVLGYFASAQAAKTGLTSLKDLPGHSLAITTIGSTTHYAVGLLAEKYGFPLSSVRIVPAQTISNSVAVLIGNQADAGLIPGNLTNEVTAHGARLLGWVGDETPWQIGSVFASTRTADERSDIVGGSFALRHGARTLSRRLHRTGRTRKEARRARGSRHHGQVSRPNGRGGRIGIGYFDPKRAQRAGRAASDRMVQDAGHAEGRPHRRSVHRRALCRSAAVNAAPGLPMNRPLTDKFPAPRTAAQGIHSTSQGMVLFTKDFVPIYPRWKEPAMRS